MALTFELQTPHDVLAKVGRELKSLENAASTQDKSRIADALYNFSVTAYHVKDWLIEHPGTSYSNSDVENWVRSNDSLSICRDICNASKHRRIKKYTPITATVTASAGISVAVLIKKTDSTPKATPFRVKAVLKDGRRIDVLQVARDAMVAWKDFFQRNGL